MLDWSPVEVRALAAHMETLRASPRASAFRRVDGSRIVEEEKRSSRECENSNRAAKEEGGGKTEQSRAGTAQAEV